MLNAATAAVTPNAICIFEADMSQTAWRHSNSDGATSLLYWPGQMDQKPVSSRYLLIHGGRNHKVQPSSLRIEADSSKPSTATQRGPELRCVLTDI